LQASLGGLKSKIEKTFQSISKISIFDKVASDFKKPLD
jgi:hypothetical protein